MKSLNVSRRSHKKERTEGYWLTPPELEPLREGRFDPTPYPHSFGDRNALLSPWDKPWYLNPPFSYATRFARRAIQEGGPGVVVLPCQSAIYLLLEAGARLHPLGRVRFLHSVTREPMRRGILCVAAVLEANLHDEGVTGRSPAR